MEMFFGLARWSLLVLATLACATLSGIGVLSF